jgi:rRNA-processing protein FCF1
MFQSEKPYMIPLQIGKTYDEAIESLDDLTRGGLNDTENRIPLIGSPSFSQLMTPAVLAYERWTESAGKKLRAVFRDDAIYGRLRAEKYWIIMGSSAVSPQTASMIHSELSELRNFFMDLVNKLGTIKARYPQAPYLVLDTNALLHYYRLDVVPWSRIFKKDIRIALPHVVIDEIDTKSYNAGPTIQRRARGVYRMLELLLTDIENTGSAELPDGTAFEILADEPGHHRLPNNDDEIVARAAMLQQVIYPCALTLVTRDIGMRARAMTQRLSVAKIPDKYLIREDHLATPDMDAALTSISPASDDS